MNNIPQAVEVTPEYRARLEASLANWKRKLLDLSRRNRALNFKPTKVSTITIVDEVAAEVFRKLYLDEAALRFRPSADAHSQSPNQANALVETSVGESAEFDDDAAEGLEFVPYDTASVDERHTDDWLQTALAPDKLDHSLRRIEELARVTLEEQGVNTLFLALGMLKYRESTDSDTWFRAPLVLLPVALTRTSARAGYVLRAGDEDALVNPALVEFLRSNFGIVLPVLPDSEAIPDTYDLQELFKGAFDVISSQAGWTIQTDIALSLFAFQKLAMFKDLERNAEVIGTHRLVHQLLTRGGGNAVYGLPLEVRDMSLDLAFPPEQTFQVVDADSSQMRAAAAVARQLDLVIEGPPGTGKSQTITNLVAQALSSGKSVLFVAEKMAALEVVHRRLMSTGLGEFCLELHSSKANKRTVMQNLSATLDASLQTITGSPSAAGRLPSVRTTLSDYVQAVHAPFGALAESPYTVLGRLGTVLHAPRVNLDLDPESVTATALGDAERALKDLATHAAAVGPPGSHPWRGAARTLYSETDLDRIRDLALQIEEQALRMSMDSAEIASRFGTATPRTLPEVRGLLDLADVLAASPGVAADVLLDVNWNAAPAGATQLIDDVEAHQKLKADLSTRFAEPAFDAEHADDIAYIETKSSGLLSILSVLDGRFRAIKRRWVSYQQPGYSQNLVTQASDMKQIGRWQQQATQIAARGDEGRAYFGEHWRGPTSSPAQLRAYSEYVVKFRRIAITLGLAHAAATVAQQRAADVSPIRGLVGSADELAKSLSSLRNLGDWPEGFLTEAPLSDICSRAAAIHRALDSAPAWAAFEASRQRAAATVAAAAVESAIQGQIEFNLAAPAFGRAFYMSWMSAALSARPALRNFDGLTHQATVDEFRALDQRVLQDNRATLIGQLRERAQARLRETEVAGQMPRLRREMVKQRKIAPLRRTLRDCGHAVRAIKPCWMMSPLTVAQYLDGASSFDLVIFDEASQLPTEDAIGTIVRGRQLVVVGDPKQLPPTNFFSVASGTVAAPVGDDGLPMYEDSESVLEEFMGAAVPMSRLKWHYRSAHESLISFSNVNFYDADLHTFPSVDSGTDQAGLQFQFVADGIYEGKGVNLIEARRVADEVVAFAKLQLLAKAAGAAVHSLGVGTLNLRQQMAIVDELEIRRRNDPSIEPFFDRTVEEPFFVKNLENIQGDERDTIYLSITYGRGVDGRIRYNFGPLNRENGWRRLNVLVTRARRQMRVFASIREHDINPSGATSDGPGLLRAFLAYAEHRRLEGARVSVLGEAESPFEREVCQELINRGVSVQPQVGVCGYRVDIGVLDPDVPGRFICGIECDGMAYHSMETVRDRDRLRQQVLEDRGWAIHRVWSTDWFKDRKGQIERLMNEIARSKEKAVTAARQEMEEKQAIEPLRVAEPPVQEPVVDRRPSQPISAVPYERHQFPGRQAGEILEAPTETLMEMITTVVEQEGPVHESDVIARLCDAWNTSAGSRIKAAVQSAGAAAAKQGRLQKRGPFYWSADGRCIPRSRAGTGISGDRIAPEEYAEALKAVLADGRALPRQSLISETRALLGFNRTGPVLESAIGNVVDALILQGALGEASAGLKLRQAAGGAA